MDLEKYVKVLNAIFTNAFKITDLIGTNVNGQKININYDDSINLFNLVSSFNELYKSFKKEYAELEKLSLGKCVEVLTFDKFTFKNNNYRLLTMYIDEPLITSHPDTILYLREINGKIMPFVTNELNIFDKNYYNDDIELNNLISKKYLDLFEKYDQLLKMYNYFKIQCVFGDGSNTIISEIKGDFLEELYEFNITFGTFDEITKLVINLGDNFGLAYDKCHFIVYDKEEKIQNTDYDYLFNNVYLNKIYTSKEEREKALKRIK